MPLLHLLCLYNEFAAFSSFIAKRSDIDERIAKWAKNQTILIHENYFIANQHMTKHNIPLVLYSTQFNSHFPTENREASTNSFDEKK